MRNYDIHSIGDRFGRLTIIGRAASSKNRESRWECLCDCGNKKTVLGNSLNKGSTKSCGCLTAESTIKRFTTHGMTHTKIYGVWHSMKARCCNPKDKHYKHYGGRGITVCGEWVSSFDAFYQDMGDTPFDGAHIDRIDNEKGYSKDNCRWVTPAENMNNTRANVYLTFNGITKNISGWSESTGIKYMTIASRIKLGWDVGRALTQPVMHYR